MTHQLTASRAALLHECQWFARPEVVHRDSARAAAARGTLTHAILDAAIRGGKSEHEDVPLDVLSMVGHGLARARGFVKPLSEQAYAWDPDTDRGWCIQPAIDEWIAALPAWKKEKPPTRVYADPEAWRWIQARADLPSSAITMTIDVVEPGRGVGDWCTGRTDKTAQLEVNALAFARAHGLDLVTSRALHLRPEGLTERAQVHTAGDLIVLAAKYRDLVAKISASEPQPGSHCAELYCPAIASCPTTQALVPQLVPASALVRGKCTLTADITSDAQAAALLPLVTQAQAFLDVCKDALKARSRKQGGIPLGGGTIWAETFRTMPRFDAAKAKAMLATLGATPDMIDRLTIMRQESGGFKTRRDR